MSGVFWIHPQEVQTTVPVLQKSIIPYTHFVTMRKMKTARRKSGNPAKVAQQSTTGTMSLEEPVFINGMKETKTATENEAVLTAKNYRLAKEL